MGQTLSNSVSYLNGGEDDEGYTHTLVSSPERLHYRPVMESNEHLFSQADRLWPPELYRYTSSSSDLHRHSDQISRTTQVRQSSSHVTKEWDAGVVAAPLPPGNRHSNSMARYYSGLDTPLSRDSEAIPNSDNLSRLLNSINLFDSTDYCRTLLEQSKMISSYQFEHNPKLQENRKTDERKKEKIRKGVVKTEVRWIKHYSNAQKILLVGEGDFSFSASLAVAFGSANNMTATSLNSEEFLKQNYGNAMPNIKALKDRGCKVIHGLDATEMLNHSSLQGMTFDRIVFNFPLAGFFPRESRKANLRRNRNLVEGFLANAKEMINKKGEIHITHKTNGFFKSWDLERLASVHGLRVVGKVKFDFTEYQGYGTKYGFGGDECFNCNPSTTYKFGF